MFFILFIIYYFSMLQHPFSSRQLLFVNSICRCDTADAPCWNIYACAHHNDDNHPRDKGRDCKMRGEMFVPVTT